MIALANSLLLLAVASRLELGDWLINCAVAVVVAAACRCAWQTLVALGKLGHAVRIQRENTQAIGGLERIAQRYREDSEHIKEHLQ